MNTKTYIPNLRTGIKVRVVEITQHTRIGQEGRVIRQLPNPSKRADNQWYDVRFNDGFIGRFLERDLVRIDTSDQSSAA